MSLPLSTKPHAGHTASRATGVLTLGLVLCLVSAPAASAAGDVYNVEGGISSIDGVLYPLGGQGFVGVGPELSTSYQETIKPVSSTEDDISPNVFTISELTETITSPQPEVVNSSVTYSGFSVYETLTADQVVSQCTLGADQSSASTTFENLVINGVAMPDDPAPNTVVAIPNGTVTLDSITSTGADQIEVKAINIVYTSEEGFYNTGYLTFGDVRCQGEEGPPIVLPVGEIGGLLLTGVLGVLFTVRQLRRRPS